MTEDFDSRVYGEDDDDLYDDEEEMVEYTIIIKVLGVEGEENMSMEKVSDLDMEVINPMLLKIRENNGYYPRGKFETPGKPTAKDLYRQFAGWDIVESILPRPKSGFSHIISVEVFREEPIKLNMIN